MAAVAAALGGCASPRPLLPCKAGESSAEVSQLFFGRNVGKAPGVSEADWEAFLEKEIVSRFPEGLSVIDTAGVWRDSHGGAVHELGKAVVIVLPPKPDPSARIAEVTAAYKARFSQESVLVARSRACVAY